MTIKDSIKTLFKTTEGIIVLGGLTLTVISPFFGPKFWAIVTAVAYFLVNIPGIIVWLKGLFSKPEVTTTTTTTTIAKPKRTYKKRTSSSSKKKK